MNVYTLTFDIKSDWHIGNGHEGGAYADALILKNNHQLPFLPGKSIKGLLRQAFQTAIDNNWFANNVIMEQLFGKESTQGEISQGAIQISSAQLSEQETDFFINNPQAIKHLYRVLQSTAIDNNSGVAKEGSLRSIEVAVPMQLTAEITLNEQVLIENPNDITENFKQWLEDALTLITCFGGKRYRGLGEVTVSCQINNEEA